VTGSSRLKLVGRCAVSLAFLGLVVRKIHWAGLGGILASIEVKWVCLASAGAWFLILGLALRWQIFLRAQHFNFSFATILSLTWAGQFFNTFLPGSTGGDVVKIYEVCRLEPKRKASAAATVLVDRIVSLLALVTLGFIGFVIEPLPLVLFWSSTSARLNLAWVVLAALAGGIAALTTVWYFRSTLWGGRLIRTMLAAKQSATSIKSMSAGFLVALAMHAVLVFIAYAFATALGTSLTFFHALIIIPTISFVVMLPLTINGLGLREWLLIACFTKLGITATNQPINAVPETAVALSLLMVANDLFWNIPGGLWYAVSARSRANPDNGTTLVPNDKG
jgi:uncharacterized membrane protein YbhN (UPF0104 family)